MVDSVNKLLATELTLPDRVSLEIQRAHRALVAKPDLNSPPTSVIVNFLRFKIKEMVLKSTWKKKVHVGEKQIFFDQKEYTSRPLPFPNPHPRKQRDRDLREHPGGCSGPEITRDRSGNSEGLVRLEYEGMYREGISMATRGF